MKILVLGASAECAQRSLAVSEDGLGWVLLNASPDIAQQIRANATLQPHHGALEAPIKAFVLTDSQLHNVAGLLSLREGEGFEVFATPQVFEDLTSGLPRLSELGPYCALRWHLLPVAGDTPVAGFRIAGFPALRFSAISVPARLPRHARPHGETVGEAIALLIEDTLSGGRLFYAPVLAEIGDEHWPWMRHAECVMVDGTLRRGGEVVNDGMEIEL